VSAHVLEHLSAYLDGELPSEQRRDVQGHLAECAGCARRLEELAAVDAAARELPVPAPAGYFDALPGRVRARLLPQAPRRRLPAFSLAAAAALVLAVLTPLTLREQRTPERATRVAAPRAAPPQGPAHEPEPETQEGLRSLGYVQSPPATTAPPPATATPPPGREAPRSRAAAPAKAQPPAAPPAEAFADQELEGRIAGGRHDESLDRDAPSEPARRPGAPEPQAQAVEEEAAVDRVERPSAGALAPGGKSRSGDVAETRESARRKQEQAPLEAKEAAEPPPKAAPETLSGFVAPPPAASRPDPAFEALAAKRPGSASEARALREAWRALALSARGTAGDEARVQVVLLGAEAYRLSRDAEDLAQARRDARIYLERADARQKERVRQLLDSLRQP
jgi:anti-sigma factor RsiW